MITHIHNFFDKNYCQEIAQKIKNPETPRERRYGSIYQIGSTPVWTFMDNTHKSKGHGRDLLLKLQTQCQKEEWSKVQKINKSFSDVYSHYAEQIKQHLNLDVVYFNKHARPGFTVVTNDLNIPYRRWHVDNFQVTSAFWKLFIKDFTTFDDYFDYSLSATLLLENPGSATYDYYSNSYSKYAIADFACPEHKNLEADMCSLGNDCHLNNHGYTRIEHQVGSLLITRDQYVHRIGPTRFDFTDKERIALQAFGSVKDNTLYLHW